MLDHRKTAILCAIVQEYIATGVPVGSSHVADLPGVKVSSATVRNEMAVLEQEGYLVQPHTSAGRIPTDRGYRFFVDQIVPDQQPSATPLVPVEDFFSTANTRIEQLMHRASSILAHLTSYAAVAIGQRAHSAMVRSVQIVPLSSASATVVVVLDDGSVESEVVRLEPDDSDAHLAAASAHLTATLANRPLTGPAVPPTGDARVDALCRRLLVAVTGAAEHDDQVFLDGTSSVAASFDAVEVVRDVLRVLEQQYVVASLVQDLVDRGMTVAIGEEHGVQPLATCSVVISPVRVDGESIGTIGVLGPTRMNYPEALATVDAVSEQLSRRIEAAS